jgi:poly-gamma-glutamate synthesis protein (capsule biosynthesis protein)
VLLLLLPMPTWVLLKVTRHPTPIPKAFNFKLHPSHAGVLSELGLSYVSLANNHVLDYEQEGLAETHEVGGNCL